MSSSEKNDLERGFAAGVYLSEDPSPPRFLPWGGQAIMYCRFWIWSGIEWKLSAEYGLQHNSTPPNPSQPHTVCLYFDFDNREGGAVIPSNQRDGERGNRGEYRSQSWVGNTNMTDNGYLQSINSVCWTGENAADHILE